MIKTIMADEKNFYVLANKKCGRVGLYLFAIDINNPENITYILNRPNKMEVSDCALQQTEIKGRDHIVLSFKQNGVSTYNVMVLNKATRQLCFWHESCQLWEGKAQGILLNNNEFLVLSRDGMHVLALGTNDKRAIYDDNNDLRMLHSLGSCEHLKIRDSNLLLFACQQQHNR